MTGVDSAARASRQNLYDQPGQAAHPAVGTALASAILLFACLGPLFSTYLGTPDLSGSEAGLVGLAWVLAILSSGRVCGVDAIIALFGTWAALSAVANEVPLAAAGLQFLFLTAPFMFLRLCMFASERGLRRLARTLVFIVTAQIVLMALQLATRTDVDDLKGTFTGTQYGEHVASFLVLTGATWYALQRPGTPRAKAVIIAAGGAAYLADAKMALGYFLIAGVAYLAAGRRSSGRAGLGKRAVLVTSTSVVGYLLYVGALGNIPVQGYVQDTLDTGGGKVAVTKLVAIPGSDFWAYENYAIGAGPGQTVSRTAELSVPNGAHQAPAARLGIPPSQYYPYFVTRANAHGYIDESSATAAASSFLGVLGDLGLVGLGLFLAGWGYIWRWVCARLTWRSWPAMAWLVFLVPGFLGEWLEFPPATMFQVAIVVLLRQGLVSRN